MSTFNPFEIFELTPTFNVNLKDLEKKYIEQSKQVHPDRFSQASQDIQLKSQSIAATLNKSFQILKNPEARLESLLELAGYQTDVSSQTQSAGQLPGDLAEEYFELQEMLMGESPQAQEQKLAFLQKLETKQSQLTEMLYQSAQNANWSQAHATELEIIIKQKQGLSYIKSMVQNLKRMP